ncbi:hypothetical protein LCM20_02735 [Halobacillus litoralis]|uniref:hypothetical protein n=1 Tax=Halobacillus litoralis TaxID=45668 RepID=UPI001CD3073E|nr:hypothetical protein [Halobacillus litoralis]MCA0969507.1 hypothetical protein [Halobacillus litoralis]
MKKMLTIIFTLAVLLGLNYGLMVITNSSFIDFSFFLGLAVAFIIRYFNSSGGQISKSIDLQVQSTTGIKQEADNKKFNPSVGFFTCMIYAGISLVVTFFYYMDYFI